MKRLTSAITVAILCMIAAQCCSAGLMTYTDRATWRAAAGGGTGDLTEDFNAVGSDLVYNSGASQTVGFLTFSTTPGFNSTFGYIDGGAETNPGSASVLMGPPLRSFEPWRLNS